MITDVALIPLSSQADANKAITQARESLQKRLRAEGAGEELESDTSDDESVTYADTATQEDSLPSTPPPEEDIQATTANKRERRSSIAEDVVVKKGAYGRFADRWFSKKGWSTEGRRKLGMSSEEDLNHQQVPEAPRLLDRSMMEQLITTPLKSPRPSKLGPAAERTQTNR